MIEKSRKSINICSMDEFGLKWEMCCLIQLKNPSEKLNV